MLRRRIKENDRFKMAMGTDYASVHLGTLHQIILFIQNVEK